MHLPKKAVTATEYNHEKNRVREYKKDKHCVKLVRGELPDNNEFGAGSQRREK
jgi:hypothetical protein